MKTSSQNSHLNIGAIIFPGMNQFDFTGPFEVLARLPDSTFHIVWKTKTPVRDAIGLVLTPEMTLAEAPQFDVLVLPGGPGQVELMEDEEVLSFIRKQSAGAKIVFSICTGVLTLAATGLLKGVKGTTHWASFDLLQHFGMIPVNQRVVTDGKFVSAAGVSSGLDGALRVAAALRGELVAEGIQLYIQYAPEPPFNSGSPETAPPEVLAAARSTGKELAERRLAVARRIAAKS
jgi:cyclohexyl-isocyanide hydratase